MDECQPPPTRNSSRTLAKVAVAVLVVIAIAGIVLGSLRGRGTPADTQAAADETPPAVPAMTAFTVAAITDVAHGIVSASKASQVKATPR